MEENTFKDVSKMQAILFGAQCVNFLDMPSIQILTHWGLVMPYIWVNIGSGNGLLPGGTKPLPEPMLTNHQ